VSKEHLRKMKSVGLKKRKFKRRFEKKSRSKSFSKSSLRSPKKLWVKSRIICFNFLKFWKLKMKRDKN
jgi:hypothetical protein